MISFDDTAYVFAHKTDKALKKARFIFSLLRKEYLVKKASNIMPLAIKWHLPFAKAILRNTIFQQFVGGETLKETDEIVAKLQQYRVQTILDYAVESSHAGERGFDAAAKGFIRTIHHAAERTSIPFISIKVTAIARFSLLEKIDGLMNATDGTLIERYEKATTDLPASEQAEWKEVRLRMINICSEAHFKKIGVLIDAEETWIQNPIDAMAMLMMATLNKQQPIVYNTIQLYRIDRLMFLKDSYDTAQKGGFVLGVKLVRGAYMEKERQRATAMDYPSPIQAEKQDCDKTYNAAIGFCINHLPAIAMIIASHNEESNLLATQLLQQKNMPLNHPYIHFSQLYGMGDNITFNLARAGCNASKYIPFGSIKDVIPYLIRRAQENSSVSSQTGKELGLIKKELERRKNL